MAVGCVVLDVPGISCSHCKRAIESAIGALNGVRSAVVDVAEKSVTIEYEADLVSIEALEAVVREEGYEVAGRRAAAG